MINCAGCKAHPCADGKDCLRGQDLTKYRDLSCQAYKDRVDHKLLEVSSRIEAEHYLRWTRLEEIIGFAQQMGYTRLGLAHCVGLTSEAKMLKDILDRQFDVESICCKFSGLDKKEWDLPQINCEQYEAICNPVGQAMVLNDLKTDLNIIVGLCIGHDILFTKHSTAPVTTFIVKDRVTGHNPAAVLYSNYYQGRFGKE